MKDKFILAMAQALLAAETKLPGITATVVQAAVDFAAEEMRHEDDERISRRKTSEMEAEARLLEAKVQLAHEQ